MTSDQLTSPFFPCWDSRHDGWIYEFGARFRFSLCHFRKDMRASPLTYFSIVHLGQKPKFPSTPFHVFCYQKTCSNQWCRETTEPDLCVGRNIYWGSNYTGNLLGGCAERRTKRQKSKQILYDSQKGGGRSWQRLPGLTGTRWLARGSWHLGGKAKRSSCRIKGGSWQIETALRDLISSNQKSLGLITQ